MKNKAGITLMVIGAVLIFSALSLLFYNKQEDRQAGRISGEILTKLKEIEEFAEVPEYTPEMVRELRGIEIDGNEYIGYLTIPVLDLELPVMAEWSYEKLRSAPCRQSGSVQDNNLVIAGHNYSRHFGKLSNLKAGDSILFTDVAGERVLYTVECIENLKENQGDKMINSEWDLTLYTCTYDGRSRVTIRANR